jgi:hypothetical protein
MRRWREGFQERWRLREIGKQVATEESETMT